VNPATSRWFSLARANHDEASPGAPSSIKRDSPVGWQRVIRRLIRDKIRRDLDSGLSAGERLVIANERVRGRNN
jgi:hypothetical protein